MIYNRQKILLLLLSKFKSLDKLSLQKHLFLFLEENKKDVDAIYEFIPYKYGCFSFQVSADKNSLTKKGLLIENKDWVINSEITDYLQSVPLPITKLINAYYLKYKNINKKDLIKKIYINYNYYAINSEIREDYLNQQELDSLRIYQEDKIAENRIYTIGYEGKSVENYLNKLITNKIKALVDVRYNPQSRKYGFSKSFLQTNLPNLGITYYHLPQLGIQGDKRVQLNTKDPDTYNNLFQEYAKILPTKANYISNILEILEQHKKIALTCFEKDVCMCHRNEIAKYITKNYNYNMLHI